MAACLRFAPPLPIMSASSSSWCFRLWTALQLTSHLRPAAKGWALFALIVVLPSWNLRLTTKQSLRCALTRDAQRGECCGCYEINAVRYLPADAGAVWRYEVTWAGDSRYAPQLQILDTHMNAIDATVHVFESQVNVSQQNGCRVNKTYLSVEMPRDIRDFVTIAIDPAGQIQSGFCAMDGRLYNGMVDDS